MLENSFVLADKNLKQITLMKIVSCNLSKIILDGNKEKNVQLFYLEAIFYQMFFMI